MRISPIVLTGDQKTIDRLEDEYRRYQGHVVKRDNLRQITVYPKRNRQELSK